MMTTLAGGPRRAPLDGDANLRCMINSSGPSNSMSGTISILWQMGSAVECSSNLPRFEAEPNGLKSKNYHIH